MSVHIAEFPFLKKITSSRDPITCMCGICFIHPPVDGRLDGVHTAPAVTGAT